MLPLVQGDTLFLAGIISMAQSLIAIVALGFGRFLGSLFAGTIRNVFTVSGETNWTYVFLVPCALTVLCAFAFLPFFREEKPAAVVGVGVQT